jgi:hypothetical protein
LGGLFGSKGKRESDLVTREEMEVDAREPEPYVPSRSQGKY